MKGFKRICWFTAQVLLCSGLFFANVAEAGTHTISESVVKMPDIEVDVYENVEGTYFENVTDAATGVKYNLWVPEDGTGDKPVIFCLTGTCTWTNESVAFGPHMVIKNKDVTPDAVVVIIQRKKNGPITNSYTLENLLNFVVNSIIEQYQTSKEDLYYYGFSQGGVDFKYFGPMLNWKAAAFADGYYSAMTASSYCTTLKAVMYNNSTGTPDAWNKKAADISAASLGLVEGESYIWNVVNGSHANINQYSVVQKEGQGYSYFSSGCSWKVNETEGLPMALNWLLQWK